MRPSWHIAFSTTVAFTWHLRRRRFPLLWWLASLLVDIDHYVWYGLTTGRWHIKSAWYGSRTEEFRLRHPRMPFHRWTLVGFLLLIGKWQPKVSAAAWGVGFHLLLDEVGRMHPRIAYRYRQWRYHRLWRKIVAQRGHRCEHCGTSEGILELHHRVPESLGGRFTPDNLVLLCPACHDRAHARLPRSLLAKKRTSTRPEAGI